MSVTWNRARVDLICGRCGHHIPVGAPVQLLGSPAWTREKRRCSKCADGPVPADLPPLERQPPPQDMTPVRQIAGLPLDYRAARVKE